MREKPFLSAAIIFSTVIVLWGAFLKQPFAQEFQLPPLMNLQALEKQAESGDIEAQLRLVDFYRKDMMARESYKKKLEYWTQKSDSAKGTEAYTKAQKKLTQEISDYYTQMRKQQEEMQVRMQKLQEKYQKMGPNAKINQAEMHGEAIDIMYKDTYSWTEPYQWRYRITINIETPEGVKTGSAVQEVFYPPADENIRARTNQGIARGEAAYVDLGQRGVVFAIMPDTANAVGNFTRLIRSAFPTIPQVYDHHRYQEVLKHYHDLRNVKDEVPAGHYPMFVYFKDINDPKTIELVYQEKRSNEKHWRDAEVNRFEEIFGKGVKIKNITLEMTDDPLDWKLDDKLPWIETAEEEQITRNLREECTHKISIGVTKMTDAEQIGVPCIFIPNAIGYYVLRQGQQDPLEKINAEKKAKQEITDRLSGVTAYDSYKTIPWILGKNLRTLVTLDQYLERTKVEVKQAIEEVEQAVNDDMIGEYKSVLELDENKDGQMSESEVNTLALRAFVTVDTDKNGAISHWEDEAYDQDLKSVTVNNETAQNDGESQKLEKTFAAIKFISAASSTFRDMYNARPGDMPDAQTRLVNCKDCGSGNGDGFVGDSKFNKMVLFQDERHLFWVHLSKAGLIDTKIFNPDKRDTAWGEAFLSAPIGGGFQVFYYDGVSDLPHALGAVRPNKGHYLILTNDMSGDLSSRHGHFLTAKQASWIDSKVDDGNPLTGSVIAAGNKECLMGSDDKILYKVTSEDKCLSLYIGFVH